MPPLSSLSPDHHTTCEQGAAKQAYLRDAVHAQAAYLRRSAALRRTAERLTNRTAVPDSARRAVLDAIDDAHEERAARLMDPPAQ